MVVRFHFCNPKACWKQAGNSLIKWADQSKSGHFAIELETFEGQFVYESVFPKSKKTPLWLWLEEYEIVKTYEFGVPAHLQFKVKEWLEKQVGKWYSIPQLILIALCFIKPLNDSLNWAILNHDRALICTEIGSRFIERFMQVTIEESHDKISLYDMQDYCDQLEFKNEVRLWGYG